MRYYPEYKESGVEWIGEIPAHWEIGKIKHIATFVSQKSTPETNAIKISPENVESEIGKVLDFYSSYDSAGVKFQAGDVLFNKLRVYLSKVVFTEYSGYSLGEMIVMKPSLQDSGKHLFYLMLSCRFIEYCNSISEGVKMPRTDVDDILNAQIPLASYEEQTQIADFLDRKTGQIDELIRIKERRIELLREQRTALINQAVTKGLDPNVEMKPSGVEWIGEIPKNWEVIRNKFIFQQIRDVGYPNLLLLSIGIRGIIPKSQTDQKDVSSADKSLYKRVKIGDIAFNVMTAWKGGIGMSDYEGIVSPAYQVCRPTTKIVSKYFHYLFRTDLYKTIFDSASYRVVDQRHNLYYDNFKDISAIFLSFSEQSQIVNFLDRKTGQIDELIAAEDRKIELLQEYRQSLISEAVTGKIDVQNEV